MNPARSLRYRWRRRRHHLDPHRRAAELGASVGTDVLLPAGTVVTPGTTIGDHTWFSGRPSFAGDGPIRFGRWCAVGEELRAISSDHDARRTNVHYGLCDLVGIERPTVVKSVSVGSACWLGDRVTLLGGSDIGDGAVVGAGSVVRSALPAFWLCAGVPARPVRQRFSDEVIELLVSLQWWDWSVERLQRNRALLSLDLSTCSADEVRRLVVP